MNKKRPVNLDIGTIKLPITSYVSIMHRVSGVILFVVVGYFLSVLDNSLASPEGFASVKEMLSSPFCQLLVWVALAALTYHLVAGIRHLIMDCGVGESLEGGRLGAKLVLVIAAILIVIAAGWVFL